MISNAIKLIKKQSKAMTLVRNSANIENIKTTKENIRYNAVEFTAETFPY